MIFAVKVSIFKQTNKTKTSSSILFSYSGATTLTTESVASSDSCCNFTALLQELQKKSLLEANERPVSGATNRSSRMSRLRRYSPSNSDEPLSDPDDPQTILRSLLKQAIAKPVNSHNTSSRTRSRNRQLGLVQKSNSELSLEKDLQYLLGGKARASSGSVYIEMIKKQLLNKKKSKCPN